MSPRDLLSLVSVVSITVNMLSNIVLLLVTWSSKQLRSTCNRLIALEAVIVMVNCVCGYNAMLVFPQLWITIPFSRCIWVNSVGLMGIETQSMMPLMIALERLLNVLYPVWALKRTSRWYTIAMFAPALFYGVAQFAYYAIRVYTDVPDEQVGCTGAEVYNSDFGKYANYKNYAVIGTCWAIYGTIWAVMRARKSSSADAYADTSFRRLTHSLFVIIALISVGWAIPPTTQTILSRLPNIGPDQILLIYSLFTITALQLQSALVCPALCLTSSEYRKGFVELFKSSKIAFCCRCCIKNHPQQLHGGGGHNGPGQPLFVHRSGGGALGGVAYKHNQNNSNNNSSNPFNSHSNHIGIPNNNYRQGQVQPALHAINNRIQPV